MTINPNASIVRSIDAFSFPQIEQGTNIDLEAWLMEVEYFSDLGTPEGDLMLIQLAANSPDMRHASPETKLILSKVKKIGVTKRWDPTLSPNSKNVLNGMRVELQERSRKMDEENPKPSCVKRLNFDDYIHDEFF